MIKAISSTLSDDISHLWQEKRVKSNEKRLYKAQVKWIKLSYNNIPLLVEGTSGANIGAKKIDLDNKMYKFREAVYSSSYAFSHMTTKVFVGQTPVIATTVDTYV